MLPKLLPRLHLRVVPERLVLGCALERQHALIMGKRVQALGKQGGGAGPALLFAGLVDEVVTLLIVSVVGGVGLAIVLMVDGVWQDRGQVVFFEPDLVA